MSMGRIFSPGAVKKTRSKRSGHTEGLSAPTEVVESKSKDRTRVDLRLVVQRRFMGMMETHDRMRSRVLGLSSPGGHAVSGD